MDLAKALEHVAKACAGGLNARAIISETALWWKGKPISKNLHNDLRIVKGTLNVTLRVSNS